MAGGPVSFCLPFLPPASLHLRGHGDLDLHVEVASLEAIDEMIEEASSPQAPYDSATMGTHTHPSPEHLGSLA